MNTEPEKRPRGFAALPPDRRRQAGKKGRQSAQNRGTQRTPDATQASTGGLAAQQTLHARGNHPLSEHHFQKSGAATALALCRKAASALLGLHRAH